MIHLHYQLNEDNFKELNCYLALHDKSMQKKLLAMIISVSVFVIVLCYIIFKFSLYTLIISFIGIILSVFVLPRIYWNMVFQRMNHFVDNTKVRYNEVDVYIENTIRIKEKESCYEILFEDIINFDYTKNICIIFYKDKMQTNTLVLPVNAFSEEQLKEFHLRLMENFNEKTRDF